ncbi:hypothetical protein CR513_07111, partial [Mucuna pruriens]
MGKHYNVDITTQAARLRLRDMIALHDVAAISRLVAATTALGCDGKPHWPQSEQYNYNLKPCGKL